MRLWSVLCVLLLAACPQLSGPPAELERELRVEVGKSVSLGPGGLVVEFREVAADSRCPAGVQCPWAGEAVVVLTLRAEGSEPAPATLRTPSAAESSVRYGEYRVELLELEPTPRADAPRTEPYVARLRVTRA